MTSLLYFRFAWPWVFLLLPFLAAAWWWATRRRSMPQYLPYTWTGPETGRAPLAIRFLWILPALGLLSLLGAAAKPQQVNETVEYSGKGVDIMLCLDISSSMLSRDFQPDRLSVAKELAVEFIRKRPSDRIGAVAFAGEAYTVCPLTSDHAVLSEFIQGLEPGRLDDGTAIGMGLAIAVSRLERDTARSKVIVLLTDGENNAGYIAPEAAARLATEAGVRIHAIGLGSNEMALSPVGRDETGEYIFGYRQLVLDETLLRQIAAESGGRYFRSRNREELGQVYAEIDRLEKSEFKRFSYRDAREFHRPFLLVALLCFLADLLLRRYLIPMVF